MKSFEAKFIAIRLVMLGLVLSAQFNTSYLEASFAKFITVVEMCQACRTAECKNYTHIYTHILKKHCV